MAVKPIFVLILLYAYAAVGKSVIRPSSSLSLMEGEGFVVYLELAKSFGEVKSCWFKFRGNDRVPIILNSTEPIQTERGERILPYNSSSCGMRVFAISPASAGVWTLEADNELGEHEQDSVTIQILPMQKTNFETRLQLEIGQSTIKCSKHASYTRHCKIIDLYYGGVYPQCEAFLAIHPSSMFECYTFNWGRIEQSHERIYVDIKNTTILTNATHEENDVATVLRCDFQDKVFSCQAEMPDKASELLIMDGVYNGHYSALSTRTSMSRCELEIRKPIRESDIGLWRIINYESSEPSGCLFYVGNTKSNLILSEISKLDVSRAVNVYEPQGTSNHTIDELSCTVPFVISDCYLRDPNNTVYFAAGQQYERQRLYGKCVFTQLPIIPGLWSCGARGRDYDKEVVQNIDVKVKPIYGETLTPEVKVKRGDSAEFMCRSPFEEPISHCAFVSPKGDVYLVATVNSVKSKGHVQYFGRGIQRGECGILIEDVSRDDFGQWRCQFVIYAGNLHSSFYMELKESDTARASSVGLAIGLTVIVILILGMVLGTIFYRRRNMSARHNFPSADSAEMSARPST